MEAPLQRGAFADHIANNGETSLSVALTFGKHDVVDLLRSFTIPTSEDSVTMVILMLKEKVIYLDFSSVIEILEML